jgi:hypothetical protein
MQFLDGSIEYSGYGSSRGWRTALIAPSGEIVDVATCGNDFVTAANAMAFKEIKKYLCGDGAILCSASLVAMDVSQMLGIGALKNWHSLRMAWGDSDPSDSSSVYPNGRDREWHLYWCGNGEKDVLLSGLLPEGWWEMDEDERYGLIDCDE